MTLGVVGLGTAAVKTAADFDSAMSKVAAIGPVLIIVGKVISAVGYLDMETMIHVLCVFPASFVQQFLQDHV